MQPEVLTVLTTPGLALEMVIQGGDDMDPAARAQLQAFERARREALARGEETITVTIFNADEAGATEVVVVPI